MHHTRHFRKIDEYILGPEVKGNQAGPLHCIKTYLAKKDENFYKLKILAIENPEDVRQSKEVIQGKMLIHNEFCILQILKGCQGIEQCHEMFVVSY